MYGTVIHQIRSDRKMSLQEASDGIISQAKLSRFEHGLTDVTYSEMVALLARLGMTVSEFDAVSNANSGREQGVGVEVTNLLVARDSEALAQLTLRKLGAYRRSKRLEELFDAATAAGSYYWLTDRVLLKERDVETITAYISSIVEWRGLEITRFGNVLPVLRDGQVFEISRLLIRQLPRIYHENYQNYTDAWNSLLNALDLLVLRAPTIAQPLSDIVAGLSLPDYLTFTRCRRFFLIQLLKYRTNQTDVASLTRLISDLQRSGNAPAAKYLSQSLALVEKRMAEM